MGEKGAKVLLRTKFRYLFGGLMVVGLLWGGLSAYGSLGPTSVPVVYEPAPIHMVKPVEPDKSEFMTPTTTQGTPIMYGSDFGIANYGISPGQFQGRPLPEGYLLPLPDPPSGGVYESVLTSTWVASKTSTMEAWRYAGGSQCRDYWRGTWSKVDGRWTVTTSSCEDLAEHLRSLGYFTEDWIAQEIQWTKVQTTQIAALDDDGNDTDVRDIPTWACNVRENNDTCSLATSDTSDTLDWKQVPTEHKSDYLAMIGSGSVTGTHTYNVVVDVPDLEAMQRQERQYKADLKAIQAHNEQAYRDAVKVTYACDASCKTAYDNALDLYNDAVASYEAMAAHDHIVNWLAIADYKTAVTKAKESDSMFVDCKLSGCVLGNKVR